MNIAVIGTGNVGGALGSRWAKIGHNVVFGSLDPKNEKVQALLQASSASAKSPREAAEAAEVIVLAVPWAAAESTLGSLGNLQGKILIDCTNPLNAYNQLAIGHTNSAGEQVAAWAEGAKVAKAFNNTGANNMADSNYGDQKLSMFICGDDPDAKKVATQLSDELGFETIDTGGLAMARYLEPLTMLWIHLAYVQGLGPNVAFKLIKR